MNTRTFAGITPQIHASAYVDSSAVVIGDVVIGEQSSIWPQVVIRGDVNRIRIGAWTNIQDGSVLHVTHEAVSGELPGFDLVIGDYVTVGHKVLLHGCRVDAYSLIGMGAVIMDGAHVQERVMVGAGSLVSPGKVLEGGNLYVGNPARRIRELSERELKFFEYSAHHYAELKDRHVTQGDTVNSTQANTGT